MRNNSRETFRNRTGVLMAMAGSAIGLGNIWRFPYMLGQNGGAAFILIYIIMLLVLCLPVMISEYLIGRRGSSNPFRSFDLLAPGTKWRWIGLLAVLSSACILSFYCVVGGWSVKYLLESVRMETFAAQGDWSDFFGSFIGNTWQPLAYTLAFLGMTGLIIALGVRNGIERMSKIMITVLFVIIVLVVIRSLSLPGSKEGVRYLFVPDFSKVTAGTVVAAMGQAFFSLSIGCGTILTYASYVNKDENIAGTSVGVAFFDTLFAVVAGLAIIPAVFAIAGMNGTVPDVGAGPGLVFITLPGVFQSMPLGGVAAILFFLALLLAALTSAISLLEVIVSFIIEELHKSRTKAVIIGFVLCGGVGILCSLSFGKLEGVRLFSLGIFDFFDYITSNIMLPLGGLFLAVFAGWRLKRANFMDELTNGGTIAIPQWLCLTIYYLVKFVAPLGIILILLNGLFFS
ncbi:MAG: sodium-dependent transporter [Bacteroidaceae bacterium]|nr:sodium-dependent transporter [Bacteroidaceae bacterium]